MVKWDGADSRQTFDVCSEYLEGSLVHVIYYKTYYLQFEMFPGLGPTQEWTGEVVVVVGMKINDVELSLMDVYGCAVRLSG